MFDEFIAWLKLSVPEAAYVYSAGMWIDSSSLATQKIIAVMQIGGPAPDVEDRRVRYRVIMLGKRNTRTDMIVVRNDIYALANVAMGNTVPCGAAQVRALSEPMGPGSTTENRQFYTLDFEVLF